MNPPNKVRIIFKSIAGLLACVFLWQQVSWATGGELTAKVYFNVSRSGFVTATKPQSTQKSESTPDVTYAYYKDGKISSKTLNVPDADGIFYYHYLAIKILIKIIAVQIMSF